MMEAVLCTKEQFQYGKEEFLDHMARLFESRSEALVVEYYDATQIISKWSKIKVTRDEGSQTDMAGK